MESSIHPVDTIFLGYILGYDNKQYIVIRQFCWYQVNNLYPNCVLVTTKILYSIYEWISFQERGKIWVTLGKSEHKFKLQQIPIKLPILKEGVWIEDTENILPHRIFWHSCLLLLLHMTIRQGIEVSRNSGGGGVEVKCNVITPESPWYISPLSSFPWYHPQVPSS